MNSTNRESGTRIKLLLIQVPSNEDDNFHASKNNVFGYILGKYYCYTEYIQVYMVMYSERIKLCSITENISSN